MGSSLKRLCQKLVAIKKGPNQRLRDCPHGIVNFVLRRIRLTPNPLDFVNRFLYSLFPLRVNVASALYFPQEGNAGAEIPTIFHSLLLYGGVRRGVKGPSHPKRHLPPKTN